MSSSTMVLLRIRPDRNIEIEHLKWGSLLSSWIEFNDVLSEWRMIDSAGYSVPQN